MLLKATAIGRLGHSPESRTTQGGTTFATMSIATTHWRGKEKGNQTVWVDIAVFNEIKAKYILDFAKKGQTIFVEGEPSARAYERRDGSMAANLTITVGRYEGDIKLVSSPSEGEAGDNKRDGGNKQETTEEKPPFDDSLENIPGWD